MMQNISDEMMEKTLGIVISTDLGDELLPYMVSMFDKNGECVYQTVATDLLDLVHTLVAEMLRNEQKGE